MSDGDRLQLDANAVVWREVEDEVAVLELATAVYLTLNSTGRLLWLLLADGATRDELVAALVERYRVDAEQAASDVRALLDSLADRSLLKTVEDEIPLGSAG